MTDSPRDDEATRPEPDFDGGDERPPMPPEWQPPPWARTTAQSPWSAGHPGSAGDLSPWIDPRRQFPSVPPYGQWGTQPTLRPEPGSSPLAVVAGTVLLLAGAFMTLIALVFLVFGAGGGELFDQMAEEAGMPGYGASLGTIILVLAVVFLILGILQMVASIGVFTHKEWARWLGIAMSALGLAVGLLSVLGAVASPAADVGSWLITILWVSAYVAALAGLAVGGEHFRTQMRSRH